MHVCVKLLQMQHGKCSEKWDGAYKGIANCLGATLTSIAQMVCFRQGRSRETVLQNCQPDELN